MSNVRGFDNPKVMLFHIVLVQRAEVGLKAHGLCQASFDLTQPTMPPAMKPKMDGHSPLVDGLRFNSSLSTLPP